MSKSKVNKNLVKLMANEPTGIKGEPFADIDAPDVPISRRKLCTMVRQKMLYHLEMAERFQYALRLLDGTVERQEERKEKDT